MNQKLVLRIAFAVALLAVLALGSMPAIAKVAPSCEWVGNCPVAFCPTNHTGTYARSCAEVEPCTDCERVCKVYVVNGQECKSNCILR